MIEVSDRQANMSRMKSMYTAFLELKFPHLRPGGPHATMYMDMNYYDRLINKKECVTYYMTL